MSWEYSETIFFFRDLEERIFDIETGRPLRRGRYLVAVTERYR